MIDQNVFGRAINNEKYETKRNEMINTFFYKDFVAI